MPQVTLTWPDEVTAVCQRDLREGIHTEFHACQAKVVNECRVFLSKAYDRHTTYAPNYSILAR